MLLEKRYDCGEGRYDGGDGANAGNDYDSRCHPEVAVLYLQLVVSLCHSASHREMEWRGAGSVGKETARCTSRPQENVFHFAAVLLVRVSLLPILIEAILIGGEPSGLSLAKLTGTLPTLWDKQREVFGFPQNMQS